jgi:hypothetical protein
MTAHAAFYVHPRTGRAVRVTTAAEATYYQNSGYVICTWATWYAYYMLTMQPVPQDEFHAVDKDGEGNDGN